MPYWLISLYSFLILLHAREIRVESSFLFGGVARATHMLSISS